MASAVLSLILHPLHRGSYPAVSTRYSKDLRSLIDCCLRHSPRDRPSINGILRMPFVQQRIGISIRHCKSLAALRQCLMIVPTCAHRFVQKSLVIPYFIVGSEEEEEEEEVEVEEVEEG